MLISQKAVNALHQTINRELDSVVFKVESVRAELHQQIDLCTSEPRDKVKPLSWPRGQVCDSKAGKPIA